jgi:hypothetical protein
MITVENLIKFLEKYPKDAKCYAYEGIEGIGIVIIDFETNKSAFISATCNKKEDKQTKDLYFK